MARQSVPKDELVVIQNGQPFTTTLQIAEGVNLPHSSVIKLVRKHQARFERLGTFRTEIQKSGGRETEYAVMNEDQATFLMTLFRNSETVLDFKEALVKAFRRVLNELDRLARQQRDPDWRQLRDKTKVGYEWMSRTLQERREAAGKATKPHHYANEARLVSAVLSGRFEGMNRNTLTTAELDLVSDLQRLNAILIGQDLPYAKRKEILMDRSITKIPEIREPAGSYLLS
jgi:phage regulator Rha-like protein